MSEYIDRQIQSDVLFGVVFGRLTPKDFELFHRHNGPTGLKVAILDVISNHGVVGNPELKERINYGTAGPIREVTAMLTGIGLAVRLGDSVLCTPTPKGRLLLDILRRLYFEWSRDDSWSAETALLLRTLNVQDRNFPGDLEHSAVNASLVERLLIHCAYAERSFNARLLEGVDHATPKFYSEFDSSYFLRRFAGWPEADEKMFDDAEVLFFPSRRMNSSSEKERG